MNPPPRFLPRRILARLLPVLCLLGVHALQADEGEREAKIKAAVIFKILKFVEWPPAAMPAPDTPLLVCLLGRDSLTAALADLAGVSTQGHALRFLYVAYPLPGAPPCHALVVAAGESEHSHPLLDDLVGRPTLSLADIPNFARRGGIVGLVRTAHRLGFEINLRAARRAGLRISAPLLELATIVE